MKRLLLSSVFCLLSLLTVYGQNVTILISGTVTDVANGNPVPSHPVYIMTDSSSSIFFYYNQVQTDNQGYYSDAVSVPSNMQVLFYISTFDCNWNYQVQTGVSTNAPIIANFSVCTGGTTTCQANFFAIPDSSNPSAGYNYYFADLSTGDPVSWLWEFGDGTGSNLQYPSHIFPQPGTYNVCLTITTATGCTSTYCEQVTVNVMPSCYAHFTYSPDTNGYGFHFYDASLGNPTNWQWDFGDGTTSTSQNTYHEYNAQGYYLVCLTIWGNNCQNTFCEYVYVAGSQNCMAAFMAYPDSTTNYTWYFADLSLGNTVAWLWNFGDGTTSTLQYPTHTYSQQGVYYTCLTIFTSDSCTSTYCDSIYAGANPNPCYSYFTHIINALNCDFYAWSIGGIPPYTYTWDFGDGSTSTLQNPSHTYAVAGSYLVTLVGSDNAGCSSTYSAMVYVNYNQTGTIWGQVMAGGAIVDQVIVYLYMEAGPASPMLLIDSTLVDSSYYHFIILNPLPGIYYVKAAPLPNTIYYTTYLPTYYQNAIFWADATPINLVQSANPYNINLVPMLTPVLGNGNINGQVTTGGKFTIQSGVPAPDVEILLLNTNNEPLGLDYSDSQGLFSFNNLAMGTYKIYAEISGLPTEPAVVTLTEINPTVDDLEVIITASGVITGINDGGTLGLSVNTLYPNPSSENINLDICLEKPALLTISLTDLTGKSVLSRTEQHTAGNQKITMNLSTCDPGTYFLRMTTSEGGNWIQKISLLK